jgi:membrane-bound ClpP family serine protease
MNELTIPDKIAMYLGGGLVVLGVVAIGIIEMAVGASHPVSGEGQIVHEALVPIEIRSYIIIAGLAIWGLYAVYKVIGTTPRPPGATGRAVEPEQAD